MFNRVPGTKKQILHEAIGPDGVEICLPIGVIFGAQEGPVLSAVAGVHGTEYCGIEAILRLHREIDPQALSGTLITAIANMPAFRERSMYVCPVDGKNLGRVFPGNSNGTYSDVLAREIFETVLEPADYVVDLHGGDLIEDLVVYTQYLVVEDSEINRQVEALALAYGAPFLVVKERDEPFTTGSLYESASAAGKVAVLLEAGGQGLVMEEFVAAHVNGIKNIMRHIGLLDEPTQPTAKPIYMKKFLGVTSPADGIFYPAVEPGDTLEKGQFLGELHDYFGNKLEDITAPANAVVLGVITTPAMNEGSMLFGLGELA